MNGLFELEVWSKSASHWAILMADRKRRISGSKRGAKKLPSLIERESKQ